ncbi:MAG: hypothetical protein U0821_06905 [Chloroflexota bacterium]
MGSCPLTQSQLVELQFAEHRNMVLEVAAFLDRLDRAREHDATDDFRLVAFRRALRELCTDEPARIGRIQMLLSDPSTGLLEELDRKSAFGAYGGPVAGGRG